MASSQRCFPIALMRGYGLSLACGRRRFEVAPCFAVETRLGQHAPDATTADLQALQVWPPLPRGGDDAAIGARLFSMQGKRG